MTSHISYHPQTGIALGPVELSADPLHPNHFIQQAYATPTPVPGDVPEGHVACYLDASGLPPYSHTDGRWIVKRDWRDVQLYLCTGEAYVLGAEVDGMSFAGIGELPAWLTASTPPDDVHVWSGDVWVIDNEREAARLIGLRDRALESLPAWEKSERAAGIEHAGRRWLTTSAALQDIRDVLLAGAVPGEQWVTADRQIVPMTLPALQSLWQAITARGAAIYQRRLEMEQQIAGMNREQLEAFVPGWPEPVQA
ncbi:DUF4376 domain-containing protein [Laribacter hongkongensis]|uniref:DUF4376 domain-containing protein n=1 Tax=Laribacter hongkongensis TaxID=168471 RepID=UPI00358DBD98